MDQTQTEVIRFPRSLNLKDSREIVKYVKGRARERITKSELLELEKAILECDNAAWIIAFYEAVPSLSAERINKYIASHRTRAYEAVTMIHKFKDRQGFDFTLAASVLLSTNPSEADKVFLQDNSQKIQWISLCEDAILQNTCPKVLHRIFEFGNDRAAHWVKEYVVQNGTAYDIKRLADVVTGQEQAILLTAAAMKCEKFQNAFDLLGEYGASKTFKADDIIFSRVVQLAGVRDLVKVYQMAADQITQDRLCKKALEAKDLGVLSAFCRMVRDEKQRELFVARIRTLVQEGEFVVQLLTGDFSIQSLFDSNDKEFFYMMHPMGPMAMMGGGPWGRRF